MRLSFVDEMLICFISYEPHFALMAELQQLSTSSSVAHRAAGIGGSYQGYDSHVRFGSLKSSMERTHIWHTALVAIHYNWF